MVREVQSKINGELGLEDEEEEGPHVDQRITPSEFLYLLCNARPRMEILSTLTVKKMDIEKVRLGTTAEGLEIDFYEGEERRKDLEKIYPFDIPGNKRRYNPRHQL